QEDGATVVAAAGRARPGLRSQVPSAIHALSRENRQGRLGQGTAAFAVGQGRADRHLVRDGMLWYGLRCQIYVNGHDYVARQMLRRGLVFEQTDNAFTQLADPGQAQRLANRFAKLPWPKILEKYVRQVNPLLRRELNVMGLGEEW